MLKMPRVNNSSGNASSMAPFPAANNFLQKKWNDRAYKKHLEKMKTTKTKLDTTPPKECPHLHLNLKKIQMEEEKQTLIDRDNRILLSKLTNILRSDGMVDNWNYEFETRPRTLHAPHFQREQERIAKENERFVKKLNNTTSSLNFDKMEDEYLMHEYYKSMKNQETKTRELDARGFNGEELPHHKKAEKTEDVQLNGSDESQAAADGDKLPPMEDTTRKPPAAKRTLRKQPTRLPLLGAERRKEEDKKKKDAISKPSPYDHKEDASKLFKAIKGMMKPESVIVQTLARRTYAQRQQTIATFTEQYELELEEELKDQLSNDYSSLVSALMAKRDEYDAISLNHALKGQGSLAETMVEILCTRNNLALKIIKEAYAKLYVELETDIKSEVKGQLKHLFIKLAKGSRNEKMSTNSNAAESDAQALVDAGSDKWSMMAHNGKLPELISNASFDHLRAVFQQYEKLSDLKLPQELRGALSGDYRDSMIALVKCLSNCASFLAEQLHLVLTGEADESTLIRIMITRSEVDMLQIRREYKKKYGELLIDSLENRCRSPIKKALIQMVLVHGVPKDSSKEAEKNENDKQTILPKVVPQGAKTKTLRGPQPNKDATMPADNPLVRSTRWQPKSPVKRVVVTPRGMNKTSPSRTSSHSGKTNTKKSLASNKATAAPKSRAATQQQQPSKPAQTKKPTSTASQRPTKSPSKSVKSPPTQPKQKQSTSAVKQEKPKSTESRTERAQTLEPKEDAKSLHERTEEVNTKDETNVEETKDEEVKKEESASDEGISSEQDASSKDNQSSGVGTSSEDQVSDAKDSSETEKKNSEDETKDGGDEAKDGGDEAKDGGDEAKDDKDEAVVEKNEGDGETVGETKEDAEKKEEDEQKEEDLKEEETKEEAPKTDTEEKQDEAQGEEKTISDTTDVKDNIASED